MYSHTQSKYYASSGLIDLEEFYEKPMSNFKESFNFFVGTSNRDLNWFDNPYVEVNVYDIDENFIPTLSKDVRMRMCDIEKDL